MLDPVTDSVSKRVREAGCKYMTSVCGTSLYVYIFTDSVLGFPDSGVLSAYLKSLSGFASMN